MPDTSTKETLGFQAEVSQLLHLMIHSLYGNKEIFLRELVSNASDAADKLRFEAMSDPALFEDDPEPRIRVGYDAAARTITVSDNGIGMSRQEVVDNIGTIAKSGTREFLAQLTADRAKDAHLIGQFGVGFYSAFIVADRVTLVTRRAGLTAEHGVRWESTGEGSYTVEVVEKATRGTDVILHLRPDEDDLLSGHRLREILRKYSDHIAIPILMKQERWDSEAKAQVTTDEDEQVNRASALWARPKSEITEEQYHELYKHVAHDVDAPLAYTHAKVEGRQEFTVLLYLPARAPFDLWDREHRRGVKLYVRRVFIMDDAEQLMPAYLRFVRGVVDSNDLPLNVSREILQQSKDVQAIRSAATKRVLALLEELAEKDTAKYRDVLEDVRPRAEGRHSRGSRQPRSTGQAAAVLLHAPPGRRADRLAGRLRRPDEGRPDGHLLHHRRWPRRGPPQPAPRDLPQARRRGAAAARTHRRVGGVVAPRVRRQAAAVGGGQGPRSQRHRRRGADARRDATPSGEHAPLLERMQTALADRASTVRVTTRLTESPACLVSSQDGLSTNLERMMKAAGQAMPAAKPILEVNAAHPIVRRLADETDPARFNDWSQILFDQATLAEGGQIEDPAAFVKRLNELMLTLAGAGPSRIWTPGE